MHNKTILVSESPGFIGSHLVQRLLSEMENGKIISFDSMNDYYDPRLKRYQLTSIQNEELQYKNSGKEVTHFFIQDNLADMEAVR